MDMPRKPSTAIPRGNILTTAPPPPAAPSSTSAVELCNPQPVPVHRVHVDLPDHNDSRGLADWQDKEKRFKWALEGSSWITEAQNYYVIGRDGSLVFMQIGYSNLGWPSTTCQISARYFHAASGANVFETQSISAMRMHMGDDYTSVTARKDSLKHHHIGDGELALIKVTFDEELLAFELNVRPEGRPFQICNGNIHFGQDRTDGFINMKFIPASHATGWVQIGGQPKQPFEGHALVVHQFQGVRPHLCASRWNLAFFVSDTPRSGVQPSTLFMIQLQTPDSYDDATINYGAIYHRQDMLAISVGNEIEHGNSPIDAESGFPIPEHIRYRWHGKTFSGAAFSAECAVRPSTQCARICLLDNVPYVLRKVVETFVARPFVYQWIDRAEVSIDVEGAPDGQEVLHGWIFQEISLI